MHIPSDLDALAQQAGQISAPTREQLERGRRKLQEAIEHASSRDPVPTGDARGVLIAVGFAEGMSVPPSSVPRTSPTKEGLQVTSTLVDEYVKTLVPAAYDRSTVAERRQTMEAIVGVSTLRGRAWFESGSWSHGTALKGHSDVDFMVPCVGARPSLPSSALTTLKTSLSSSHWDIRNLKISSPTVKVEFYSVPHFEVVPAWYSKTVGQNSVYLIPGPGDEWVESAPRAHLHFVSQQNDRLEKRVKPLVRLLKQWKAHVGAPVSSFYLEMRVAEYASEWDRIDYHLDCKTIMGRLIRQELRTMNDPVRVVSRIRAVSSEENRRTTLRLLEAAKIHLDEAYDLDRKPGRQGNYWEHMQNVFGASFPWPTW